MYMYMYISTSQYETMVQTCATCYVPYQKRQRIWIVNSPCSFKLIYKSDYSLYIPIMSPYLLMKSIRPQRGAARTAEGASSHCHHRRMARMADGG